MQTVLLVFLIILVNLTLYWLFFGKKRFEDKWHEVDHGRTETHH